MKRFYTLLAICAMALTSFAQPTGVITYFTPTVDGVMEDGWDALPEYQIDFEVPDDFGQATVWEGYFKISYNDTAIFLLVRRDEDDFAPQWVTGLSDWQSDRDEIFFNVNVNHLDEDRGAIEPGTSYGCYQWTSIWQANEAGDAIEPTWDGWPNQWYHNSPFELAYVVDGNAYYTEYCFPATSLAINLDSVPDADSVLQIAPDVVISFEAVISDVDMADNPTDESFRKFLRWANVSGWDNMKEAGRMTFLAPVSGVNSYSVSSNMSVYPSPATSTISIKGLEGVANVEIVNMLGAVVLTENNVKANQEINISQLTPGMYFAKLNDEVIRFSVK